MGKELLSKQHPGQEPGPPLGEKTRENMGFKNETVGRLCYFAPECSLTPDKPIMILSLAKLSSV